MSSSDTQVNAQRPKQLAFKPDFDEAVHRCEAFFNGDIIDRPIVCVNAHREGYPEVPSSSYHDRVFGDMDKLIDQMVLSAEGTFYGGEAFPVGWLSFGCDEIACFCGAELEWSEGSGDTNWAKPFVEDWDSVLPLRIRPDNPLWQRILTFYRKAAERAAGKMLLYNLDLHSNIGLLRSLRGSEQLCMDLVDNPEAIDRAMASARAIFPIIWNAIAEAGKMKERGFCHGLYSLEGYACLQCDFSCMIGPRMFDRWVLPALEEEAEIVKHAIYHWDGPDAIKHADALIATKGLHTLSYVPGEGRGTHLDYIDLLQRVQKGGKAVEVWGSPDQIKLLHRKLRPEKTIFRSWVGTPAEAEELLEWFKKNT